VHHSKRLSGHKQKESNGTVAIEQAGDALERMRNYGTVGVEVITAG
jgi:hypothetical protein